MKKRLFLLIILFVGCLIPQQSYAQEDLFRQLETVSVGENLDEQITASASSKTQSGEKTIYTFPSSDYSHPHIVYAENSLATFIQLTIPSMYEANYHYRFDLLAEEGPVYLPKTESEVMYGFPEKGMAFIFGYDRQVERFQNFRPQNYAEFMQGYGKNYKPVIEPSPKPSTWTDKFDSFWGKYSTGLISAGAFLAVVCIFGLFRILFRFRGNQNKDELK